MLASPIAMHLPDGFLPPLMAAIGWLLTLFLIGQALRKTGGALAERQVPLLGILAAFIFAAQAINFPIAGGTSGHLLGGTLAAVLVGPWAASLVMTAVIMLQGFLFQDGGLLVMGWNVLNMAVITSFVGYGVVVSIRRVLKTHTSSVVVGSFVGAWLSVVVSAGATALELAAAGTFPLVLAMPAMVGVHALIGLGEAVITAATLSFLLIARPALLLPIETVGSRAVRGWLVGGLSVSLLLALLSPLASTLPDGLEAVAERGGFAGRAAEPLIRLLPDYSVPLIADPIRTTIAAVVLGTLLAFAIGLGLERWLAPAGGS
ncbi:MAG: energy-coupling factor ABC transporter permease [Anaerolineales bacterium]